VYDAQIYLDLMYDFIRELQIVGLIFTSVYMIYGIESRTCQMDFEKRTVFFAMLKWMNSVVPRSGWICFSNDAPVASHLDTWRTNPNLIN